MNLGDLLPPKVVWPTWFSGVKANTSWEAEANGDGPGCF
jgi:hypothetical protein